MNILSAFVVGLVFGLGLIVSGMSNPAKVLGFLDLGGLWDPSLAFVMAGAILIGLVAFRAAKARPVSLFGGPIDLPTRQDLTPSLVLGSLAFGVGWGLAGFCPGPALVALGMGERKALIFVLSMLAGMAIHHRLAQVSHSNRKVSS